MRTFKPEVFIEIVERMNRNMESVMTILTPLPCCRQLQFCASPTRSNQGRFI